MGNDKVPVLSTLSNLFDLFQKCIVSQAIVKKSHYYTHLNKKSFFRCVVLLVPIFGNIAVISYDLEHQRQKEKRNRISRINRLMSEITLSFEITLKP